MIVGTGGRMDGGRSMIENRSNANSISVAVKSKPPVTDWDLGQAAKKRPALNSLRTHIFESQAALLHGSLIHLDKNPVSRFRNPTGRLDLGASAGDRSDFWEGFGGYHYWALPRKAVLKIWRFFSRNFGTWNFLQKEVWNKKRAREKTLGNKASHPKIIHPKNLC